MATVDYAGMNAAAQVIIDAYLEAFNANGQDPANVPMEIPRQLWDAGSWQRRMMTGKDTRAKIVLQLADGSFFQILPQQYDEFILAGAGVPDPSGINNAPRNLKWRWVNTATGKVCKSGADFVKAQKSGTLEKQLVGHPGINAYDITNDFIWDQPDDEALANIMALDMSVATLTADPFSTWPKAFIDAFVAGHPDYKWDGPIVFEPKPYRS